MDNKCKFKKNTNAAASLKKKILVPYVLDHRDPLLEYYLVPFSNSKPSSNDHSTHCPKCSIGWQWHIRCRSHVMGILLTICYLPLMLYSQSRKWSKYQIQLLSTLGRKTSIVPNRGVTTLPVDNIPRFPCIPVSYLKTQCWLWAGFPLCWSIGAW